MSPAKRRSSPSASPASPAQAPAPVDFSCPQCGALVRVDQPGSPRACPSCKHLLGITAQLAQLLARWYEPRRWRADLVKPSVPYLVERLWTANGQGERLYAGVSPRFTNYDIFRNMVTRLMIQGIDAGWAELTFPPDPLAEDPQYVLTIRDSERFADGVEKLFPEVDWDEPVAAEALGVSEEQAATRRASRGKGARA